MTSQPSFIGKYEIVRRLGRGGMGTVYLGRDRDLDRPVAIKVLRASFLDEELLQRFLREARAAANLRHENIITVYEVGQHDSQPFMAMEYVDGTSLAELVGQRQPLSLAVKLSYIEQLCSGLHHAHCEGIIHRDVKPANVMVDRYGVIRILDFGIARVEGSGMTSDGALMGTLGYMSPEQMLGRPVDYRTDIFAVGAVAYELLSYRQAFPGSIDDGILQRLPNEDPPALAGQCPGLPSELEAIVGRALAKRPEERFRDLEEIRMALRRIRQGLDPDFELKTIVVPRHRGPGDRSSSRPGSAPALTDPQERQRVARERVTEADVKLSRGDLAGAASALEEAFVYDPRSGEAHTLLARVRTAAEATAFLLPPTLAGIQAQAPSRTHAATAGAQGTRLADRPEQPTLKEKPPAGRPYALMTAAGVAAAIAIAAGAIWLLPQGGEAPPALVESPQTPPATQLPPSADTPAPIVETAPPPVTPAPVAPAPTAAAPVTNADAALRQQLDRIFAVAREGDLATAIQLFSPLESSTNARAMELREMILRAALASMRTAADRAASQNASTRASATFAAASEAGQLAVDAERRVGGVEAARRALAATDLYRRAEAEARAAAVSAAIVPSPSQPPVPPVVVSAPPSQPTVAQPAAQPVAAAPVTAPASAPAPSILEVETPGILAALGRYQAAYRARSVAALEKVVTGLEREFTERLEQNFRDCRDYDADAVNSRVFMGTEPTTATLRVRITYTCTPRGNQRPTSYAQEEVFDLTKVGGTWFITSSGNMSSGTRR